MIQASNIVKLARTKEGQVESGGADGHSGNIVWVWDWWKKVTGQSDQGSPWCAAFVSWVFGTLGLSSLVAASNAHGFIYCPDGMNFFKNKKQWFAAKDAKPGDIVFYGDKGVAIHVGIVIYNKGTYLVTIEGNTSPEHSTGSQTNGGGCYIRNRALTPWVLGVGRPAYKS